MHIKIKKLSSAIAEDDRSAWYAISLFQGLAQGSPGRIRIVDDLVEMGRQRLAHSRRQAQGIDIGTEIQPGLSFRRRLVDIAAMFKSLYHEVT